MVDSGDYLWECLNYVELNMVRCGAVKHPREWPWSGYEELMGLRRRNRLLDIEKLLWLLRGSGIEELREHLEVSLAERITKDQVKREAKWTESLAVGSQSFVENLQTRMRNRRQTKVLAEGGSWMLQERYESVFEPQNPALADLGGLEVRNRNFLELLAEPRDGRC
jgi:putative transposase